MESFAKLAINCNQILSAFTRQERTQAESIEGEVAAIRKPRLVAHGRKELLMSRVEEPEQSQVALAFPSTLEARESTNERHDKKQSSEWETRITQALREVGIEPVRVAVYCLPDGTLDDGYGSMVQLDMQADQVIAQRAIYEVSRGAFFPFRDIAPCYGAMLMALQNTIPSEQGGGRVMFPDFMIGGTR